MKNFTQERMFGFEILKRSKLQKRSLILRLILLTLIGNMSLNAQIDPDACPLPCNNNVQVSLDGNCEAIITADMILEDEMDGCNYTVVVTDKNGFPIPTSPMVTSEYIGQTLQAQVFNGQQNSCWANIHIEDKLPPIITCFDDLTVSCNDWFNELDFSDQALEASSGPIVVGPAAGIGIAFQIENTTSQILVVESISLTFDLPEGVTQVGDISVDVFSSLGASVLDLPLTVSLNSDDVVVDVTGLAAGTVTLDEFIEDFAWVVSLTNSTLGVDLQLDDLTLTINATGPAMDNCTEVFYETVDVRDEDIECTSEEFSFKRTFFYRAYDEFENFSTVCEFNVYFERRTLEDIVFPADTTLGCDAASVALWDRFIVNDYPDAHITEAGAPTIDGNPIFPNEHYCEINITFEDQRIDLCQGNYKVLRKWTALDWCTPDVLAEEFQIIKVGDFDGELEVSAPNENTMFPVNPYECAGTATLDPPLVNVLTCSRIQYTVGYLLADEDGDAPVDGIYQPTGEVYDIDQSASVEGLPLGRSWIRYTVFDECGNQGEAFTEVDMFDNAPPFPICDQFTVVTLTSNGYAQIFAESFDDGSYDNCTPVTFAVRRVDYDADGNHFCEETTADDELVFARTFNGNDYFESELFCCMDIGNLDLRVELLVCDEFGNCNTCWVNVEVQDKLDFEIICPPNITVDCREHLDDLSITGVPESVLDNCGEAIITFEDRTGDLNNCGLGRIRRDWTATLGSQVATCTQRIDIENLMPSEIIPPPAEQFIGCYADLDLEVQGPQFDDDNCTLFSSTFHEQEFFFSDSACVKIIREYTVIDWCLFDDTDGDEGLWNFNQVIKVNNEIAPEILNCADVVVDAFGENCDEFVNVVLEAEDDCSTADQLIYFYEIDYNSNGTKDVNGNTNDASRIFPVGTHTIYWSVEDMCGNLTECHYEIEVVDDKNPTPYCLGGITTVVMNDPNNLEVTIWANDFDLGSFDNCDGDNVFLSFSEDINDISMTFTCADIGLQDVEVWVTDQSGNNDFCVTSINIQDNSNLCGAGAGNVVVVAGRVVSETDVTVENVQVELVETEFNAAQTFQTVTDGEYAFTNQLMNRDYSITASRDDNPLNGVSTLDLVLIQKHILGIDLLESPYKVIAADVNNSESVTAVDLVELRKLILGVYTEFPDNESWRFVNKDISIADVNSPWPLEEVISIDNISTDMMDNDFVGIKVGDVNANAIYSVGSGQAVDNRSASYDFMTEDQDYLAGDIIDVEIKASSAVSLIGYQYTISHGQDLSYVGFEANEKIVLDNSNFGILNAQTITTSWNLAEAVKFVENEIIYTLKFRALTNGKLSNSLRFDSSFTQGEVVTADLSLRSTALSYDELGLVKENLIVYQNNPNPFSSETTIAFELATDEQVSLRVTDITGKIVYNMDQFFTAGQHSIQLNANQINATGMLFYQLSTANDAVSKKMLILK